MAENRIKKENRLAMLLRLRWAMITIIIIVIIVNAILVITEVASGEVTLTPVQNISLIVPPISVLIALIAINVNINQLKQELDQFSRNPEAIQ